MTWMLVAWLCGAASGECRPVQAPFPDRGACLKAERTLKREATRLTAIHCRRLRAEPAPES